MVTAQPPMQLLIGNLPISTDNAKERGEDETSLITAQFENGGVGSPAKSRIHYELKRLVSN